MKYLEQLTIILLFTCAGDVLHYLLPFPIPSGIYGMLLLFSALLSGLVKKEKIKQTGRFLIAVMPVLFVEPAASGLLSNWQHLRPLLLPGSLITILSTLFVMTVSGRLTQHIIMHKKRKGDTRD